MTPSEKLYHLAFEYLGQHLSLNETVPIQLGCAQALSYLLKKLDYPVPSTGISGTATLFSWLQTHFTEIPAYEVGAVIISVTGTGLPNTHGHVGVCGHNSIMSNDSEIGLWEPYWTLTGWLAYYRDKLGMKVHFFRPS